MPLHGTEGDMENTNKLLIAELQANGRFKATCPSCGEDFRLVDAELFLANGNRPAAAVTAFEAMRERMKDHKREVTVRRDRITKRAEITARAVNIGKIVEKIVPSFATFTYPIGDCRALFEPIDYIVFSGLSNGGRVESVSFIDIKSGGARLSAMQRTIKGIVEGGAVKFGHTQS